MKRFKVFILTALISLSVSAYTEVCVDDSGSCTNGLICKAELPELPDTGEYVLQLSEGSDCWSSSIRYVPWHGGAAIAVYWCGCLQMP